MVNLACRTKHGLAYMECFQERSSSVVPRRLLSFFPPLFLPVFLSKHPPILLCLCLLLRAAKSVMVTALPCPSVGVGRSSGPFDTHALAPRVLGQNSVLHPRSPHLSSGHWWGDNPLSLLTFQMNTQDCCPQLEQPSTVLHLMISSCCLYHNQLIYSVLHSA